MLLRRACRAGSSHLLLRSCHPCRIAPPGPCSNDRCRAGSRRAAVVSRRSAPEPGNDDRCALRCQSLGCGRPPRGARESASRDHDKGNSPAADCLATGCPRPAPRANCRRRCRGNAGGLASLRAGQPRHPATPGGPIHGTEVPRGSRLSPVMAGGHRGHCVQSRVGALPPVAPQRGITGGQAVGKALPLVDRIFDCALCVTAICFRHDLGAMLSEFCRVLRSAGVPVIGCVDRTSAPGRYDPAQQSENVFYRDARDRAPARRLRSGVSIVVRANRACSSAVARTKSRQAA